MHYSQKSGAYTAFLLNDFPVRFRYNGLIETIARALIAIIPTDQITTNRSARTPQDAEANLRAELAAQLANAASELESQLIILRGAGQHSALSQALNALDGLAQLQKQVSQADIRVLATMRGTVGAYVASTFVIAQQATSAGALASAQALEEARNNARAATDDFMRDYFENRKFDRYLQFASREDEEQYRRNEEARRREIEKARAEGTPQGDLRAAEISLEQLEDAGAHGADRSPDYQARRERLKATAGKLTAELDRPARESNKGAPDPLDAAKPAEVSPELLASIRASGLTLADNGPEGHGVNHTAPKSEQHFRG